MRKTKFDPVWMRLALDLARFSTCARAKVGCVVVTPDAQRVLAVGYNGSWRGGPNGCDRETPGDCGCFPANVKVHTKEGLKKIQDIVVGDIVLTHENRYRSVTKVLTRADGLERDFVTVKIKGGQRFVSTADHPVLVKTNDGPRWERIGALSPGHVILHTTSPCQSCGRLVASYRKNCYRCFLKSSKGAEFRDRASKRMRENNPMRRLYAKPKQILDDEKVQNLIERQKIGQKKLERKLFELAQDLESRGDFRAIVVDHTQKIPDIVLIDWENRTVTAVEYEKMQRNVRLDKYGEDSQYDDVKWIVNQRWDEVELHNDFACLPIKSIDYEKRTCDIFNLEVEEDNSYVCQNIVVHNCLHAEDNACIKLDYNDPSPKVIYCTCAPCGYCAKRIINAGIGQVIYLHEYRKTEGLTILSQAKNIQITQMEEGQLRLEEDGADGTLRQQLRTEAVRGVGHFPAGGDVDQGAQDPDPVHGQGKT